MRDTPFLAEKEGQKYAKRTFRACRFEYLSAPAHRLAKNATPWHFLNASCPLRVRVQSHKETGYPSSRDTLFFGGEGGTRTLAPVTRPTPLAGAPRHQLEYFSI